MSDTIEPTQAIDDAPFVVPTMKMLRRTRNPASHGTTPKLRWVANPVSETAYRLASEAAFPWHMRAYPGHQRGILTILGNRVTAWCHKDWKRSGRPAPWAATALATYLRQRAAIDLRLADELMAYVAAREAEPPRRGPVRKLPDV